MTPAAPTSRARTACAMPRRCGSGGRACSLRGRAQGAAAAPRAPPPLTAALPLPVLPPGAPPGHVQQQGEAGQEGAHHQPGLPVQGAALHAHPARPPLVWQHARHWAEAARGVPRGDGGQGGLGWAAVGGWVGGCVAGWTSGAWCMGGRQAAPASRRPVHGRLAAPAPAQPARPARACTPPPSPARPAMRASDAGQRPLHCAHPREEAAAEPAGGSGEEGGGWVAGVGRGQGVWWADGCSALEPEPARRHARVRCS